MVDLRETMDDINGELAYVQARMRCRLGRKQLLALLQRVLELDAQLNATLSAWRKQQYTHH